MPWSTHALVAENLDLDEPERAAALTALLAGVAQEEMAQSLEGQDGLELRHDDAVVGPGAAHDAPDGVDDVAVVGQEPHHQVEGLVDEPSAGQRLQAAVLQHDHDALVREDREPA